MSNTALQTTCAYCGVGCGVNIPQINSRTIEVSGDDSHSANQGRLCVKGTHLGEVLPLRSRLLSPQIKGSNVGWDTATQTIAQKIKAAVDKHGPDSFAFYLSGQLLTEDYYAANKLAKGFIGTANVDTNSRLCMSSAVAAHVRAFGEDAPPSCYEDLEEADLVVLTGSNLAWAHPVLFQRLQNARAGKSTKKLIVIDPRKSASAKEADLHLPLKPGTDGKLFNALLVHLAENGHCNHSYIKKHVENFEETLLAAKTDVGTNTQIQADLCGLTEASLLEFFKLFSQTHKTTTVWSMGINQAESGVDKGNAIINAHLATGRIGQPGATAFSVTGQPNAMGGREVGGLANQLAVHRGFDEQSIQQVEEFWQAPNIATQPGLKAVDLFDACLEGKIKVLWIMATNPVASLPDANRIREALENVDTVIVSDVVFENDTLDYADIALPALAWGEKDGTVTNSERTISRQRAFLLPPGKAQADWWAVAAVADKMGYKSEFNWQHSHDIFREHAQLSAINNNTPLRFNLSAASELSLEDYQNWQPQQWPIDGKSNSKRLFNDGFFATVSGKANMVAVKPTTPAQPNKNEYFLNTGRLRDQWHTMARTGFATTLNQHTNQFEVHINPQDAQTKNISNGDLLKVSSAQGNFYALARLETAQNERELFAPMHWNKHFASHGGVANAIEKTVDPISGQPASKHSTVTLEKANSSFNGFLFVKGGGSLPAWLQGSIWFKTYTHNGVIIKFYQKQPISQFINSLAKKSVDFSLTDTENETAQWIDFDETGLCFWLNTHTTHCDWPDSRFLDEATITQSNNLSLNALISGSFDDSEDQGKTICTCFSITDMQINNFFIDNPDNNLESLQQALKCGTNCGSCLTEVKELVRDCKNNVEFYEAV